MLVLWSRASMSSVIVSSVEVVAARVSPPPEQAALRALRGEWVFVAVSSADGITGYGEATHSGDDGRLAAYIRRRLAPRLAGQRIALSGPGELPLSAVLRPFLPAGRRGLVFATAVSAIEQALWDLAARAAGMPLYQALGAPGGAPGPPALYATLNRGLFDRSPEGFAAGARRAVAEGFRAIKCAPFDGVAHHGAQEVAERRAAIMRGLDRIAAVREIIGPNIALMVDCHGRLTEHEAIEIAPVLARHRLQWLEEPVPFEPDPASLARVRRASPVPIAAGELMFGVDRFRPLLEAGAVDIVMPDVKHCGGITAATEIARLAAEYGVTIAPHNPSGPIGTLASAHLCAALPNAILLEFAWGEVGWRASLITPPEPVRGGRLTLRPAPGLGADLNWQTLAAYRCPL